MKTGIALHLTNSKNRSAVQNPAAGKLANKERLISTERSFFVFTVLLLIKIYQEYYLFFRMVDFQFIR